MVVSLMLAVVFGFLVVGKSVVTGPTVVVRVVVEGPEVVDGGAIVMMDE